MLLAQEVDFFLVLLLHPGDNAFERPDAVE